MTTALVGATIFVFFGTWILHSYQWFWLRGSFPLTGPDALFWGILGALVVVNSLQEAKRGAKRRRLRAAAPTGWSDAFGRAARIVGMFCVITVLWSLWSSPSVGAWLRMLAQAGNATPAEWLLLALGIGALVAIGAALQRAHERGWQLTPLGPKPPFQRAAVYVGVLAFLLLGASRPTVQQRIGTAGPLVASLQVEGLNADDETQMDRGYYEGLLEAPRYTNALWLVRAQAPDDWDLMREVGLLVDRPGLLDREMSSGFAGQIKRAPFRTNEWGMRDRSYTLAKPPGTHRIALVGASYTLGAGVTDEAIWPALIEDLLNREAPTESRVDREILNFAVSGYSVLHNLALIDEKVTRFDPDVLLLTVHSTESTRLAIHLARILETNDQVGVPGLDSLVTAAGVTPGLDSDRIRVLLEQHEDVLLAWTFAQMRSRAVRAGIIPAVVYVPLTIESLEEARSASDRVLGIASGAGLITLSVHDVWGALDTADLQLAAWDTHPNVLGHRLIAERLYQALTEQAAELALAGGRAGNADTI